MDDLCMPPVSACRNVLIIPIRWKAMLAQCNGQSLVELASLKLVCGNRFCLTDRNHVFAVVSQRYCLDPILAGAEAIKLADRSVSHHMRLLTGFSDNRAIFYTHSPSEPILALGAFEIMYPEKSLGLKEANDLPLRSPRLGEILKHLSKDLCGAGLVDKGHLGELCARILLLTARDYVAMKETEDRNLLTPVRLLDVLSRLFGTATWAGEKQKDFDDAFQTAYVNFTHWVTTRDPLPNVLTQ
jgi:hypothetical protein